MISQRWIDQTETKLACMAPSPARDELAAELEAAKASRAEESGKLSALGLQTNRYPGNCVATGVRVQGGEGFVKKGTDGRWLTYSRAGASEVFGI